MKEENGLLKKNPEYHELFPELDHWATAAEVCIKLIKSAMAILSNKHLKNLSLLFLV